MAYRLIYSDFWMDPTTADEMTPEDRYFYFYLLTNPCTTSCGIYTITPKRMAYELGYTIETANNLLDRFVNYHKLIRYNPETKELAIKNWGKYNLNCGGKPIMDSFTAALSKVKDKSLIEYVLMNIKNETFKKLYRSFTEPSPIRPIEEERHVPRQEDNTDTNTSTSTSTNASTYASTFTEKDTEKEEVHNQAISILQEYEKLTGRIGILNIPALKIAITHHGYGNVKKAINKALEKGRLNMSYVNGILRTWAKEGYPKEGENYGTAGAGKNNGDDKTKYRGFKPKEPKGLDADEYTALEKELL